MPKHPNAHGIVGLDFETYSAAPLPSVGLKNYVKDETFRPTLAAVATNTGTEIIDFVNDSFASEKLRNLLEYKTVVAHNAGFERAVLDHLGIYVETLYDSAVVAAASGANRHLAGAARQLLDIPKLDEDGRLLRLFAMPQKEQDDLNFDTWLVTRHPVEWQQFKDYCMRDAVLSRRLYLEWFLLPAYVHQREMRYARITERMNERGWPVDVNAVGRMAELYHMNLDELLGKFTDEVDKVLNLASHDQVKKWCAARGVKSNSFDKEHVDKMIRRLVKRQQTHGLNRGQEEVLRMLFVKQELGGSSLKKLETILWTQHDGRLYDQYVHAGAAQSLRTSGRSVQMQNLPRLVHKRDISDLFLSSSTWSNEELSQNLRQVFRHRRPDGLLYVADYGSIESRALAWLANEDWKLEAYRDGVGIYESLASQHFGVPVSAVSKDQRTFGKVGELSCGYGAGPVAVKDFAAKMGVELNEAQAKELVYGWRDVNGAITKFWERINEALEAVVEGANEASMSVGPNNDNAHVKFFRSVRPASLTEQADRDGIDIAHNFVSVTMQMIANNRVTLSRVFHGCHKHGNDIHYYKPSSLKGGDPWKRTYTDPKTGRPGRYKLYGGKLTGILTQSLCREIFFHSLKQIDTWLLPYDNAQLIGQFHDEAIVEWEPGALSQRGVEDILNNAMGITDLIDGLPMTVDVKWDREYVK
jgi:DNA polymerase